MSHPYMTEDELDTHYNPILAAHRVAQYLETIAYLLPGISAEVLNAYVPGIGNLEPEYMPAFYEMYRTQAQRIREACPIEPLTDSQKQEVWENQLAMVGDLSARDVAEIEVTQFTDADWRYQYELIRAAEEEEADSPTT